MTETPETLIKLAQRVHDEYVQEGQTRKEELIQEAEKESKKIHDETEKAIQKRKDTAEKEHKELVTQHNTEIQTLEQRIEKLKEAEINFSQGLVNLINNTLQIITERITDDESPKGMDNETSEGYLNDMVTNFNEEEQLLENTQYTHVEETEKSDISDNATKEDETILEYNEEANKKKLENINDSYLKTNDSNDREDYSKNETEYDKSIINTSKK